MDVISEAEVWIRQTLLDNPNIVTVFGQRVFSHPGPRYNQDDTRVQYPICTYEFMYPQPDLRVVGAERFWSEIRFLVRGIMKGNDATTLGAGAAAIFESLNGAWGSTDGAIITSCVQDRPYKDIEILVSTQYIHLGGEYVIQINTV